MLRIMCADAHCAGISVLNLNVNVIDRGIERAWIRVRERCIAVRTRTREEHHVRRPLLKSWRVCSEHKSRPGGAKPNQTDSGPDVDRPGETIAPSWHEQDA